MKKVWVNGCFDILHYGHNKLLEYARSLGDWVVVGIDSDDRVKERKGISRPFHSWEQRAFNLLSTKYVDRVVVFNTDNELTDFIIAYSPQVMVVGEEYKDKKVIGSQYAKELIFFPKIEGFSTSKILEQWQSKK